MSWSGEPCGSAGVVRSIRREALSPQNLRAAELVGAIASARGQGYASGPYFPGRADSETDCPSRRRKA